MIEALYPTKERKLRVTEYGNPEGKKVLYFHGAPGAPEESSIFERHAKEHDLNIICIDRFSINLSLRGAAYYKHIENIVRDKIKDNSVGIIGFSIGCHVAIEISNMLGSKVRGLHLISAAAPLDAGGFLNGMAGKSVFTLAMKAPKLFTVLSFWQVLLAKLAPSILFKILFSSAAGNDKELSKNKEFIAYINSVLSTCFSGNVKGYIREINQYIKPWGQTILNCTANTYIWHGANDNWSPVSMAVYLAETIPGSTSLEIIDEMSHYSCLYEAAPKICSALS